LKEELVLLWLHCFNPPFSSGKSFGPGRHGLTAIVSEHGFQSPSHRGSLSDWQERLGLG